MLEASGVCQRDFAQSFLFPGSIEARLLLLAVAFTVAAFILALAARRKRSSSAFVKDKRLDPAVLDLMPSLVVLCDGKGRIIHCNTACQDTCGLTVADVKGRYFWKLFPDREDVERLKTFFDRLVLQPGVLEYQGRLLDRDGKPLLIRWSTRVSSGQPLEVISSGIDLTRFEQSEAIAQKSEREYKNIIDNIGIGISLVRGDAKRIYMNKQMARWFSGRDYGLYSICHNLISNSLPQPCSVCPTCLTLKDGQTHTSSLNTRCGDEDVVFKVMSFPIRDKDDTVMAAIEMVEDMTRVSQQEELIRRNYLVQAVMNSLLRFSLENISLGGFLDCALNIVLSTPWFSSEAKGIIYLVADDPEALVLTASKKITDETKQRYQRIAFGECACGLAASRAALQFIYPDSLSDRFGGDFNSYGHYCVPIIYAAKILGVIDVFLEKGHQRDQQEEDFLNAAANTIAGVIQRKRSEERIGKINEGLINLGVDPFENIQQLVILCGDILRAGFVFYKRFESVQDSFYSVGQYNASPANLDALRPYEQLCHDLALGEREGAFVVDHQTTPEMQASAGTGACSFQMCMGQGVRFRGKTVGVVGVFYRTHTIPADDDKKFLGIVAAALGTEEERIQANLRLKQAYDELKAAQHQLVQSEKMAALGRFSSGVAHEVKNPLGIILGGIEYLERKLHAADKDVCVATQKIKEATLRADGIVRNLLRFAMPSQLTMERVNPRELLNDTIVFFKYRASLANLDIVTEFCKDEFFIQADKNQLQQVLFNLLMNASEAISGKGQITIRLNRFSPPDASGAQGACRIEIIDTGAGVRKEDLPKLFEPFFTTKREKKGTGLGLSISRMIVENHTGTMSVESEPGKGTIISIVLPLAD